MKRRLFIGLAFAALAAGGCFLAGNSAPRHQYTPDEIANIEALTAGEATITCSRPPCGRCYDRNPMKECVFTGYQFHYCC
ncbi:MAG: hypothetical protein K2G52_07135 [Muribaculaceae bacterium]|nr:hypothetical protein [Muribaculaceae bacterium]